MADVDVTTQSADTWPQLNSALMTTAGAMAVGGAAIALVGLGVAGWHVMTSTRQWMGKLETPPAEVARLKWEQAKTAAAAGATTWRGHPNNEVRLSRRLAS